MAKFFSNIFLLFVMCCFVEGTEFVKFGKMIIRASSLPNNSLTTVLNSRTLSYCSLASLQNGSELFIFDPITNNCMIGTGITSILEASKNSGVPLKTIWANENFKRTPHFFMILGKAVVDLSLNESLSPSLTGCDAWINPSVYGHGRRVGDQFWVCGGGTTVHHKCASRNIGTTSGLNDTTTLPDEPSIHHLGSPVMIGSTQWLTGGTGAVNGETSFWTNQGVWLSGPNLPIPLHSHCVIQLDSQTSFLIGGVSLSSTSTISSVYKYDWETSKWSQTSSMAKPRNGHACWLVENPIGSGVKKIIVAGGQTVAGDYYDDSEIYDVNGDTWSPGFTLPSVRYDGTPVTVNNRYIWFGGKVGTGFTATILEYDPLMGWINMSMVLPTKSSKPVVIPYNL